MGILRSVKKRIDWFANVEFDKRTGFYRYRRYDRNIYIRYPRHFLEEKWNLWICKNLVYHHYLPQSGDVVLDLGAGYGEEAVYLSQYANGFHYLGVEAQYMNVLPIHSMMPAMISPHHRTSSPTRKW